MPFYDPTFGEQLAALKAQVDRIDRRARRTPESSELKETVEWLVGLTELGYAETEDLYTFGSGAGWTDATRPNVTVTSNTGRLKVTVSGAASSGNADFTFSIDGAVTRASRRPSVVGALVRCARASGGASFYGSTSKSWIVDVPAGASLTIRAEIYGLDAYVTAAGVSLLVEVVPAALN